MTTYPIKGKNMKKNSYPIISKTELSSTVSRHVIHAPRIAAKARAGQFVILRGREGGERFPITLVDWDDKSGNITLIIQSIGKSTSYINSLNAGDAIENVAGPLGCPVEIKKYGTAVCVGGGVGIAEVYPIAKALREGGNKVISILGARNRDLLILEKEMHGVSDEVLVTTDDGSLGEKGLVTNALEKLHSRKEKMDAVFVIGPIVMMKFVAELTRKWAVPTYASLNPIMLDGTGMCGGCRVEIGGKSQFACVDGPMFDAHQVNFDQLMSRTAAYREQEKQSLELFQKTHKCKLGAH